MHSAEETGLGERGFPRLGPERLERAVRERKRGPTVGAAGGVVGQRELQHRGAVGFEIGRRLHQQEATDVLPVHFAG